MPKGLTIEKRDKIKKALLIPGNTKDNIAKELHCSKTTIIKVENGDYDNLEDRIVSKKRTVSNKNKSGLAITNQTAGPDFDCIKSKEYYRKSIIKATHQRSITQDESNELLKFIDNIFGWRS